MTLAVEPGVYESGIGAVTWEDDLVITDHGCEVISRASTGWILQRS
jgi:Xaa-Pro aminopeptidase